MKAISYLRAIRHMDSQIYSAIEEIATYEAMATSTTSVLSADRVQTSINPQKMADYVSKIIDAQKQLNQDIDEFVDYKKKARDLICQYCDSDCITLLHKRYFGTYDEAKKKVVYRTWEQIAVEMDFTYKWVSGGLHQRALAQLQKGLDDEQGR